MIIDFSQKYLNFYAPKSQIAINGEDIVQKYSATISVATVGTSDSKKHPKHSYQEQKFRLRSICFGGIVDCCWSLLKHVYHNGNGQFICFILQQPNAPRGSSISGGRHLLHNLSTFFRCNGIL